MVSYIISFVCVLVGICLFYIAYLIAQGIEQDNKNRNTDEPDIAREVDNTASRNMYGCGVSKIQMHMYGVKENIRKTVLILKKWKLREWLLLLAVLVMSYVGCYRILSFNMNWIANTKLLVTSQILMMVALIDLYTKKIPNKFVLILFVFRGIIFVFEIFLMKEQIPLLVGGSLIGLIGSFCVLFLMSRLSKGGFGMGDVKLMGAIGFLCGLSSAFYTLTFALLVCMIVTIYLLITKTKDMKDEIPFGPFIYIGFTITIILRMI